ncbi:MAG: ABC transporter permease [Thermoleophilia bacterium]
MARPGAIPTIWGGFSYAGVTGQRAWRNLRHNRQLLFATCLAALIALLALIAPLLPIQDPLATDYDHTLEAPGSNHILGTDLHGRDVFSRVIWASRPSLAVGLVATSLALAVGMLMGGLAAMGGRLTDITVMRTADAFLSFPVIIGAMAIMAVMGPGLRNIFIAIAAFGWPVFARLFRSSVLTTRELTYVKAARVLGASRFRIFFSNILPNSSGPIVAYTAIAAAGAILAEAGLSFINLGVQRPQPSWGLMLAESRGLFELAPWLALAPGIAVTITTFSFIMIGSSLSGSLVGDSPGELVNR